MVVGRIGIFEGWERVVLQEDERGRLPDIFFSESCDQRGGIFWRVGVEKFLPPANDAFARLRGGFLFQRNVALLTHELWFMARATAKHVGEMFDAVLPGVGGFAGRDSVRNVARADNVSSVG